MVVDYNNSKIYKLVSDVTDAVYIGSTTQRLSQRLSEHKASYKLYLNKKFRYVTSFELFKLESPVHIVLIQNFPCKNKDELHARERYYIESESCLNRNIPGRSKQEYRNDNREQIKEYFKEYYVDNREEIKEYSKQYYLQNKEEKKAQVKQYYVDNKETIKEKFKEKVTCQICKCEIQKYYFPKHTRSKKHQSRAIKLKEDLQD